MTTADGDRRSGRDAGGFTLFELSIVLVIIGLLAGSVLVGRDLIRAAEIRKIITQEERLDAAVLAFRLKFNCLPGDCSAAAALGLSSVTAPRAGNGDGMIEGHYVDDAGEHYESLDLLLHLRDANLLSGLTGDGYAISYPLPILAQNSYVGVPINAQRLSGKWLCRNGSVRVTLSAPVPRGAESWMARPARRTRPT